MNRRTFMATSVAALATPALAQPSIQPQYSTRNARWQAAYDKALAVLAANVQLVPRYSGPVLIEGADYAGIWMECGPHEALVYRKFRPDVARNAHMTFFELQRMDGQLPCNNKVTETGFGQIQMVVPIAATAWELAQATGDEALLHSAYTACSAWDSWLLKYRNTRGTGLTEGFCTYDTGHDNSPRWTGIPPQCPNKDAKRYPEGFALPRLCPDLSATTYGARLALGEMARALGKGTEADLWAESADKIRRVILERLYVAEDAAFFDLDANDQFVRVRSDILSRVCGEHVVDQALFDELWARQIHNPQAFWTNYPMPSVALDDPQFVRPLPKNSWGGPSQALTALRAPRWMEHYGRAVEFSFMMTRWCEALAADMTFRQQLNPQTGAVMAEDLPNYSPAALVMMDFTWRLAGVVEARDTLHWNVRPGHAAAEEARFDLPTDAGAIATMAYDGKGAALTLAGKPLGRIEGMARLVTTKVGAPQALLGISEKTEKITLRLIGRPTRKLTIKPNERIAL
ncbi:MAG: alpha-L-rhamnosidase [Asticcacaulis sp.]|uniref:MGH1-like glycoside hydrolase domain-containing protein n=1 Tax=Asticcacaulis sp. TaxID=1872648 RepID=UPI0039E58B9F